MNRPITTTFSDGQTPTISYSYDANGNWLTMVDGTGTTTYTYDQQSRPITITTPGPKSVGYRYDLDGNRTKLVYPDGTAVTYSFDTLGRQSSLSDWASRVVTYTYDAASRLSGVLLPNQTRTDYEYDLANRLTAITNTATISTSGLLTTPTHIYSSAGVYSVTLTAGGEGGAGTITRTAYITAFDTSVNFLNGAATMQRPNVPAPHSTWQSNVTVKFFAGASSTPSYTYTLPTDDLGHFTVAYFSTSGTYSVTVKGSHTMGSIRKNLTLSSANDLDFCTLLEGDANDSNQINITDFSILSAAFDSQIGDPNYDARADFNQDGFVNSADQSLLQANYGKFGNQNCTGGESFAGGPSGSGSVSLALDPGTASADAEDIVQYTLAVDAGTQPVGVLAAYLDFDANLLEVVDSSGSAVEKIDPAGKALDVVLRNEVDNSAGRISYVAGTFSGSQTGKFAIATFRVKVLAKSGQADLAFVFNSAANRLTAVNEAGERLGGTAQGARVYIGSPIPSNDLTLGWLTVPLLGGSGGGELLDSGSAPTASFVAQTRAGHAPFTAVFSDTSAGDISWRLWDFGDGGIAGTPYLYFRYQVDKVGNRTALTETIGTTQYSYDQLYRLTGVTMPDSTRDYDYDPVGNRLTMTVNAAATGYAYDRADRISQAGSVTYTLNANGNLVQRGNDRFGYDQANRLITATIGSANAAYQYDGDGKRISTTVGSATTQYLYDVNRSLPVLLDDGSRKYVWGSGLAYSVDAAGNVQVYYSDGLGSIRAVADITGTVIQTYRTDEFGVPILSQGGCKPAIPVHRGAAG